MYCSPACQREHWSKGGHKAACKAAQTRVSAMATGRTANSRAKARVDSKNACIICLDAEPEPIQSGCACRGDAGLAHVKCRAEAAVHRQESADAWEGWYTCGTCGQYFTGVMHMGLAKTWWRRVRDLPQENMERLAAYNSLGTALLEDGKYARAEAMFRELLSTQRRVLGAEHPDTLMFGEKLAGSLNAQGKYTDAEAMLREVLPVQRRVLGPEHPDTLGSCMILSCSLHAQGNHTEAEAINRELLAVQRRLLGPEH